MKRILALIITICAASYAADWYAGARIGHAFEDHPEDRTQYRIGSTAEFGAHVEKDFDCGVTADLSADYAPGKENGDARYFFFALSQAYVSPQIGYKTSIWKLSPYAKIGPVIGFGLKCAKHDGMDISSSGVLISAGSNVYSIKNVSLVIDASERITTWKKMNRLALIGTVYSFIPHIGIDYRF